MFKIKVASKKILPKELIRFISYYKAYLRQREDGIFKILDVEVLELLKEYPPFRVGEVPFLKNKIKFPNAPSFKHSVEEIFCDEVYRFSSTKNKPFIIDCGANIGLSVIYFKNLFPESTILAFEPDLKVFNLLKENVENFCYDGVQLENLAVWNKDEELSFFCEGGLSGSLTTDYTGRNNINSVKAVDLLQYMQYEIDFLKLDIEGAERIVLEHIAPKLFLVNNMFVEYHSDKEKPQELNKILAIISRAGFRYYIREAANSLAKPFISEAETAYDLQLNIFCYRNKASITN